MQIEKKKEDTDTAGHHEHSLSLDNNIRSGTVELALVGGEGWEWASGESDGEGVIVMGCGGGRDMHVAVNWG